MQVFFFIYLYLYPISPTTSPEGYRFSFHFFRNFGNQDERERQGYTRWNTKNYLVAILGVKTNKATYAKAKRQKNFSWSMELVILAERKGIATTPQLTSLGRCASLEIQ